MIDSEIWWDRTEDCGESGEIILGPWDADPEDLMGYEDNTGGNHFFVEKELFFTKGPSMDGTAPPTEDKKQPSDGWDKRVAKELLNLRGAAKGKDDNGKEEDFVERAWQRVNTAKLNWRKLLDSFIQEEVCDYSFTPPDRRLQDSEFFLPDYNVLTERPKEVLFMVDTSGSIDEDTLSAVYAEICNALTQFNGGLVGVLCFFDMVVHGQTYFSDVTDLLQIKPYGGGGTDFNCIFEYINRSFENSQITNVVIFTDGEAEFPDEGMASNTPVLWLFTEKGVKPPWGKYAYVE